MPKGRYRRIKGGAKMRNGILIPRGLEFDEESGTLIPKGFRLNKKTGEIEKIPPHEMKKKKANKKKSNAKYRAKIAKKSARKKLLRKLYGE